MGVNVNGKRTPAICIEIKQDNTLTEQTLFKALQTIAEQHQQTQGIAHFFIHKQFPMDIRHNAKIFREKLALWAQQQIDK